MERRHEFLQHLADICTSIRLDHPVRVAIDGIDAAGKTSLADELVDHVQKSGREIIRGSIDRFHNPKSIRYQRGRESAEGYYQDSFNTEGLISFLLKPLGPNGSMEYRNAIHDVASDLPVDEPTKKASRNAILLYDGVFLLRPELFSFWDLKIFLDIDLLVAVERSCLRDKEFSVKPTAVLHLVCNRYIAGNRIYLNKVMPKDLADVVIDNNDLQNPRITKNQISDYSRI